jgi:hypothetical protein
MRRQPWSSWRGVRFTQKRDPVLAVFQSSNVYRTTTFPLISNAPSAAPRTSAEGLSRHLDMRRSATDWLQRPEPVSLVKLPQDLPCGSYTPFRPSGIVLDVKTIEVEFG